MPAINDLTPDEERMFAQHGVQSAGPGSEPIAEGGEQQPTQQPVQQEPEPTETQTEGGQPIQQPQPSADRPAPPLQEPQEPSRHREDGTFKSREEYAQDMQKYNNAVLAHQVAQQQSPTQQQPQPTQQQPQTEQPPQGFVPHAALHAERTKAQNFQRMAQLATARMNAMLLAQQQNQPTPQMPDLAEQPMEYIQELDRRLSEFERIRQEETQYQQLDQGLEQDEQLFAQTVPDYDQASDYYVESRARELLALHTPDQAQRILTQEARAIAQQAWQRGMNAGQVVYQLAQARGFQPGNTAANPMNNPLPPTPQPQPQPQQFVPQNQQPGGPTPQSVIAAINNNQQNGPRSIGGGGGSAAPAALNAEALLNMSDAEFDQYLGLGKPGASERFANIG